MRRAIAMIILCFAASSARADDAPVFFADVVTHCQVARFPPDGNFTVRWSGACVAGKAEGDGIAEWQKDGAPYSRQEGTFHAGLREGRGFAVLADGGRTEGEFRGGRLNGRCVVTLPKGARVDAQCVNDELNGKGVETWPEGNRYKGDFRDRTSRSYVPRRRASAAERHHHWALQT
jgi:MORN repeat protein